MVEKGEGCKAKIMSKKEGPDRTNYPTNNTADGRDNATDGPTHSKALQSRE